MQTHPIPLRDRRRGFTLVELLVVIGIVVLLVGIAVPLLMRAYGRADRSRLSFQLQSITGALEAYRSDFGDYPSTSNDVVTGPNSGFTRQINDPGLRGARTLQKALMGFGPAGDPTRLYPGQGSGGTPPFPGHIAGQDGAGNEANGTDPNRFSQPGFGFRVNPGINPSTNARLTGRVYGPYLNTDAFRVGYARNSPEGQIDTGDWAAVQAGAGSEFSFNGYVLLDVTDRPILYYPPINPRVNVNQASGFLGRETGGAPNITDTRAMYRVTDNSAWVGASPLAEASSSDYNPAFQFAMGDRNNNGQIDAGETPAITGAYVIWMAGPDTRFFNLTGITSESARATELEKMDDVTTFRP